MTTLPVTNKNNPWESAMAVSRKDIAAALMETANALVIIHRECNSKHLTKFQLPSRPTENFALVRWGKRCWGNYAWLNRYLSILAWRHKQTMVKGARVTLTDRYARVHPYSATPPKELHKSENTRPDYVGMEKWADLKYKPKTRLR